MNEPDLLNIPAAARLIGVSPYRIRAAVEGGELPAVDVAVGERRHIRIDRRALEVWHATLRRKARRA